MRYDENDKESSNVEDRRAESGRGGMSFPGSGGMQIPFPVGGKGGFSFTTMLIIGALMLLFGLNPLDILKGGLGGSEVPPMSRIDRSPGGSAPFELPKRGAASGSPQEEEMKRFVGRVLKDTEDVWGPLFRKNGLEYVEPKLVLYRDSFPTACGTGQAAMGPFYCPEDQKIYIDLAFYEELKRKFQAPGDFAQAYVVAHEVGHHVQTLLGIAKKVMIAKSRVGPVEANKIQVRMELQADCYAGFWASHTHNMKNRLEPGDIEEGLRAAQAIGDDMIQKKQLGRVMPESFTHGSSEQRMRWFMKGVRAQSVGSECDTFSIHESQL